jgi:hypothetical protein
MDSVNSATVINASSADSSTVQGHRIGVGPEEGVECSGGQRRTVDCIGAATCVGYIRGGGNEGQHLRLSSSVGAQVFEFDATRPIAGPTSTAAVRLARSFGALVRPI